MPLPAATLLRYNFEGSNPWTGMAGYFTTAGGTVAATPTYSNVGTIDAYGTSTASSGLLLTVDSSAAVGNWSAGMNSGVLPLLASNTRSNMFLTLSFSLSASAADPVWVYIESFDSSPTPVRTGGLKALIYPAAANFYQRFVIDLDKMTPDGAGVFNPTNSNVRISFQIDNTVNGTGWPNVATNTLQIDNVNYATPNYYVKPAYLGGNDSHAGTTEATALATPQQAAYKVTAGDIVAIMDGATYTNSSINGDVCDITTNGAPEAWIVFKNYPGVTPVLQTIGWQVFKIYNSASSAPSYIEIRGLKIRGLSYIDTNGDRQISASALAYVGNASSGGANGNGIAINGNYGTPKPHHFRFADNTIELCPAAGIGSINADRMIFENNIIRSNVWWTTYAGSAISTLQDSDTETSNTNIYRNLILNNQVYGNECMIPWITSGQNLFSDGEGIIADTLNPYTGRTLIQNNLVYQNGGSGIQAFSSSHVDIVHNTVYHNGTSPRLLGWGQFFLNYAADVRSINNIFLCQSNLSGSSLYNDGPAILNQSTVSIYLKNNIYYGGEITPPSGGNNSPNLTTNPLFLSLSLNPLVADYHVHSNSPALNYAQAVGYRSSRDLAGNPRSLTGQTDSGVYETTPNIAFAPVFTPASGNYTNAQSVMLSCDTPGATIVYTTNGTVPAVDGSGNVLNGTVYTAAISISAAINIQALAWASGLSASYVNTGSYTFITNLPACVTPTFGIFNGSTLNSSTGGVFNTLVTSIYFLARTPGAYVRYTTDGSTPTPTYGIISTNKPIAVVTGHVTYNVISYNPESARPASAVATATFSVNASLGNLSSGSTTVNFGANNVRFVRFQNVNTNVVTRIFARVGAITGNYQTAIYSDNAGVPNVKLVASAAVANTAGGWQAFTLSAGQILAASTYYWLAIWSDNSAATIYTDTSGGTVNQLNSSYSSTWPSGGSSSAVNSYSYSIYAMTDAANLAPVVDAGIDLTNTLPTAANLSGTATDDGVPLGTGTLTTAWSLVSGPGTVTFANSNSLATTATFSAAGTYVLQLVGNDALLTSTDAVTVTVVNSALFGTTTALASSSNPATNGANITFTATVTSTNGIPAGSVTFSDGATTLGTATLNGSGVATFTTNNLFVGSHPITAAYGGNGTYSASTSATLTQIITLSDGTTRLFAINAGGPAISGSGFAADTGSTGGAITSTANTISLAGTINPAPMAVYQTERYGTNFTYTFTGLAPSNAYLLRLHFSENWGPDGAVGKRFVNASVNGIQKLINFDIFATAGATNKAVIQQFNGFANISGQLVINFTGGTGAPDINALVDGLEIYTVMAQTPLIGTLPATTPIIYGQTLTNSTLGSGNVTNSAGSVVAGSFAFATPSLLPKAGSTNVAVIFTPTDLINYTTNTASVTVTVNPAPLGITANSTNKIYNGVAFSGGNGVTYSGFVNGETSAVLSGTLSYGGTSQGAINGGTYSIIPAGLTSANYSLSYTNGVLTIIAIPVVAAPAFTNGQFTFTITGTTGSQYVVQATTNLNPASWISLITNMVPFNFTDTNAALINQRFYRGAFIP